MDKPGAQTVSTMNNIAAVNEFRYELSRPDNGFKLAEQYLVNGNELGCDPQIKLIL